MIARQTWAILLDSYRELNAKKLFWITMILSVLIVIVFAMVTVGDKGVGFLWLTTPGTGEFAQAIDRAVFYKFLMQNVGIGIWLAWVATILALVSTSTIFPDLVQSGSIDLMLSKPISRVRLFLTKYVCGLLFVALQVSVFSVGTFFVVGIRGGSWEPGLFLAVPIVTLFFSYLFSVCALLGVITRSAIASLLLTIMLWFGLWGLNTTEGTFIGLRAQSEYELEFHEPRVAFFQERLDNVNLRIEADEADPDKSPRDIDLKRREYAEDRLKESKDAMDRANDMLPTLTKWGNRFTALRAPLPKTNETIELLNRYLMDFEDLKAFLPDQPDRFSEEDRELAEASKASVGGGAPVKSQQQRVNEVYSSRSLAWVIGTSLGFEGVMIAIAAFLFHRRDF